MACVAGDEEGVFPSTVDEEPVSCTSGWAVMSWFRGRLLEINHVVSQWCVSSCSCLGSPVTPVFRARV
jgi:hypothetical protein